MAWLFSKRCQDALKKGKLKASFPLSVRLRILNIFNNYNQCWDETTDTGWSYSNSKLRILENKLKEELGCKELVAFPEKGEGQATPGDFEGFVLRGNYPPFLIDAIELFYTHIKGKTAMSFQGNINAVFEESNLPWRMVEGKVFPVDSAYIEEEILRKAQFLLSKVKFHGALEEFEKARVNLVNQDYKNAIDCANMAVESTIKGILKIDKAKPGELFRKLIESRIIPEYFSGFLKCFEEQILRCTAIIRNEELGVGHGQGAKVNIVPPALAELAVHLAAVIINFLIKRHTENKG